MAVDQKATSASWGAWPPCPPGSALGMPHFSSLCYISFSSRMALFSFYFHFLFSYFLTRHTSILILPKIIFTLFPEFCPGYLTSDFSPTRLMMKSRIICNESNTFASWQHMLTCLLVGLRGVLTRATRVASALKQLERYF